MIFNKIYKKKYKSWNELEQDIETIENLKEKGDIFEQFAFAYFTYFKNIYQVKELFMGPDIPKHYRERFKFEKRDSGVDGLII